MEAVEKEGKANNEGNVIRENDYSNISIHTVHDGPIRKNSGLQKTGNGSAEMEKVTVERERMNVGEKLNGGKTSNINKEEHKEKEKGEAKKSMISKELAQGENIDQEKSETGKKWNETKMLDDMEGEDLSDVEEEEEEEEEVEDGDDDNGTRAENASEKDIMLQRFKDGVYIEIDMKNVKKPHIIDFYSECLNKYKEEENFIYYQSYSFFNKKPPYMDHLKLLQMSEFNEDDATATCMEPKYNTVREGTHVGETNKGLVSEEILGGTNDEEGGSRNNTKGNNKEANSNVYEDWSNKTKKYTEMNGEMIECGSRQKENEEYRSTGSDNATRGGNFQRGSSYAGQSTKIENDRDIVTYTEKEEMGNVDKGNINKNSHQKGSVENMGSTDNTPNPKSTNALKTEAETKGSSNGSPSGNELAPNSLKNKSGNKNTSTNILFNDEIRHFHFQKKKQESLDPLLKCINSLTDRINLQHLVGDPTTYFKVGGGDRYYDINDPFLDDDEMYKELNKTKNEIMLTKQIEDEYSVWSEELSDDFVEVDPDNFFSFYNYKCVFDVVKYEQHSEDVSSKLSLAYGSLNLMELETAKSVNSSNSSSVYSDETTHFLSEADSEETEMCTLQLYSSSSDSDISSVDNHGNENKTNTSESTEEDIIFNPFAWKKFERRIPPEFIPIYEKLEKQLDALPLEVNVKKIRKIMKRGIVDIFIHITEQCKGVITAFGKKINDLIEIDVKLLRWLTTTMVKMSNSLTDVDIYRIWFEHVFFYNFKTFIIYEKEFVTKIKKSKIFEKHNTTPMNNILRGMILWKNYKERRERMKREMMETNNTLNSKGLTNNGAKGEKEKEREKRKDKDKVKEKDKDKNKNKELGKEGSTTSSPSNSKCVYNSTHSEPFLNKEIKNGQSSEVVKKCKSLENLIYVSEGSGKDMKQTEDSGKVHINSIKLENEVDQDKCMIPDGKNENNQKQVNDIVNEIGEMANVKENNKTCSMHNCLSKNEEMVTDAEETLKKENGSTEITDMNVPTNIPFNSKNDGIIKYDNDEHQNIDVTMTEDIHTQKGIGNTNMANNNTVGKNTVYNNNSSSSNNNNNNNNNKEKEINEDKINEDIITENKNTVSNDNANVVKEKEEEAKKKAKKKANKKNDKRMDKLKKLHKYFKFFSDISKDILNYVKFYSKQKCLLKDMTSAGFEALIEIQNKHFVKSPYTSVSEIFTNLFNFRYKANILISPEYMEGLVNYYGQKFNINVNVETGRNKKVFLFDTSEMNNNNIIYYREKTLAMLKDKSATSEEDLSRTEEGGGGGSVDRKRKETQAVETQREGKKKTGRTSNMTKSTNATSATNVINTASNEETEGNNKKIRKSRKPKTAKTDAEESSADKQKVMTEKKNEGKMKRETQKKDMSEKKRKNVIRKEKKEKESNEQKKETNEQKKETNEQENDTNEHNENEKNENKQENNKIIENEKENEETSGNKKEPAERNETREIEKEPTAHNKTNENKKEKKNEKIETDAYNMGQNEKEIYEKKTEKKTTSDNKLEKSEKSETSESAKESTKEQKTIECKKENNESIEKEKEKENEEISDSNKEQNEKNEASERKIEKKRLTEKKKEKKKTSENKSGRKEIKINELGKEPGMGKEKNSDVMGIIEPIENSQEKITNKKRNTWCANAKVNCNTQKEQEQRDDLCNDTGNELLKLKSANDVNSTSIKSKINNISNDKKAATYKRERKSQTKRNKEKNEDRRKLDDKAYDKTEDMEKHIENRNFQTTYSDKHVDIICASNNFKKCKTTKNSADGTQKTKSHCLDEVESIKKRKRPSSNSNGTTQSSRTEKCNLEKSNSISYKKANIIKKRKTDDSLEVFLLENYNFEKRNGDAVQSKQDIQINSNENNETNYNTMNPTNTKQKENEKNEKTEKTQCVIVTLE